MSTFTLEIKPAPELTTLVDKLIAALVPKPVTISPQMNAPLPQSPAEQAARMRMQQTPAPTYDPRNPRPQSISQIYPQMPANPTQVPPYATSIAPAAPTAPPAVPIRNPQPGPTPVNPPTPAPMQNNPMMGAGNTVPAAAPVPSQPVPIAPSINPAPVAAAPAYEQDQLARAASTLVDAGKMQQVQQLFQQFKIQRMDQLPKERYGEFATALRGLGVRI